MTEGKVERFPQRAPAWLFITPEPLMRLMVSAAVPLENLHAVARSLRIPRRMFQRGSAKNGDLPYYRLTRAMHRRAVERFGERLYSETELCAIAADVCFRRRRGAGPRTANCQ